MIGDHVVLPYSSIGLVNALNVVIRVYLCFPQFADVSTFDIFVVLLALFFVRSVCCA